MRTKLVRARMMIANREVEVVLTISCLPTTPDTEIIRRARNEFLAAAGEAKYLIVD
jgi:hypothetical protein